MAHIVIDARIISSSTGRYTERLLHYLEKIDTSNKYTVLVREKDKNYWQPTNPNFSVDVAEYAPHTFSEQLGFLKQLNTYKADLVHFTQVHQPVRYRGRKITTIHDFTLLNTYNPDKNWFIFRAKQLVGRFVFRHVVKTSAAIVCPTNYTRDELLRRYRVSEKKVSTTHLAGEMRTKAITPYEKVGDSPFIMYVGQQSEYKNVARLGDAHQRLLATHPDLKLVLVGKIDNAAKRNQDYFNAAAYKNIIFTGFTEDDQLNWLYKHAAAYVFPSRMEGFGLPGIEAMMMGAPVVSSSATCLPEVYEDAAIYFDPLNVADMTEKIGAVLSDAKLRNALIEKGYAQAKKYSWETTTKKTHDVYLSVL
jgi:glycosyltransferase involved in cell wall biosynthesis